jgi:hypothetical protein
LLFLYIIEIYIIETKKKTSKKTIEEIITGSDYCKETNMHYGETIDLVYSEFHQNKEECLKRLGEMEKEITNSLIEEKISKSYYEKLYYKIMDYVEMVNSHDRSG